MFKYSNNTKNNLPSDNLHWVPEKTLRTLLLFFLIVSSGYLLANHLNGQTQVVFLVIFNIILLAVSFLLLQRGNAMIAQISLPTTLFIIIFIIVISGFGLHDVGMFAFAAVISLAGLALGQKGTIAYAVLVIISVLGIGMAEIRGVLVSEVSSLTTLTSIAYYVVLVIAYTAIQVMLTNTLRKNAKTAQHTEKTEILTNQELRELKNKLEDQIYERNQQIQKNADQLAAISDVSHAAASIQDVDELLDSSVNLVSNRFGYDEVSIFLLDETGNNIILRAVNNHEGKEDSKRGFVLSIDSSSIVGTVAKNQTPYSSQFAQNEIKPEIAVPMKVGSRLIGVLDIKNDNDEDLSQEDIMIVSTLSDILAVAVEKISLLETTRNALIESVQSFQHKVKEAWYQHSKLLDQHQYHYQNGKVILGQIKGSNPDDNGNTKNTISIPLFVGGQKIGVLDIKPRHNLRRWTKEEIALVEATADRAALALENSRLLEEAQRRAARERVISNISANISRSSDLEVILRNAVQALGQTMGGAEVVIELDTGITENGHIG
jgi:GAF domain-containing protein